MGYWYLLHGVVYPYTDLYLFPWDQILKKLELKLFTWRCHSGLKFTEILKVHSHVSGKNHRYHSFSEVLLILIFKILDEVVIILLHYHKGLWHMVILKRWFIIVLDCHLTSDVNLVGVILATVFIFSLIKLFNSIYITGVHNHEQRHLR